MALIKSYKEFWPYYLSQHSQPSTRYWHYLGTSMFFACLIAAAYTGIAWFVLLAFLLFYGPAWVAHFVIEHNRPATWKYPIWSFISDIRMCLCWFTGNLHREFRRTSVNIDITKGAVDAVPAEKR
jgi:hypothetical protein